MSKPPTAAPIPIPAFAPVDSVLSLRKACPDSEEVGIDPDVTALETILELELVFEVGSKACPITIWRGAEAGVKRAKSDDSYVTVISRPFRRLAPVKTVLGRALIGSASLPPHCPVPTLSVTAPGMAVVHP